MNEIEDVGGKRLNLFRDSTASESEPCAAHVPFDAISIGPVGFHSHGTEALFQNQPLRDLTGCRQNSCVPITPPPGAQNRHYRRIQVAGHNLGHHQLRRAPHREQDP
jgi:hypothetical protein